MSTRARIQDFATNLEAENSRNKIDKKISELTVITCIFQIKHDIVLICISKNPTFLGFSPFEPVHEKTNNLGF